MAPVGIGAGTHPARALAGAVQLAGIIGIAIIHHIIRLVRLVTVRWFTVRDRATTRVQHQSLDLSPTLFPMGVPPGVV